MANMKDLLLVLFVLTLSWSGVTPICPPCSKNSGGWWFNVINIFGTSDNKWRPVCTTGKHGDTRVFPNKCELSRHNCIYYDHKYSLVQDDACATQRPVPTTPTQENVTVPSSEVSSVDVSNHPNIGLINAAQCGQATSKSARITNGQDAGLLRHPWMVFLDITENETAITFSCDGSLISSRHVLTAAHCTSGFTSPLTIVARLGEYDLSGSPDCAEVNKKRVCAAEPQDIPVSEIIQHPRYTDWKIGYDIALLTLSRAVTYDTPSIKPICLPVGMSEQMRDLDGLMMTVTGWGLLDKNDTTIPDVLQSVEIPVVSNAQCSAKYSFYSTSIGPGQMCAGGFAGKGSCQGDSGGPLTRSGRGTTNRMTQYGVVSYGADCGSSFPGVYTRVGSFMKWILDNMTNKKLVDVNLSTDLKLTTKKYDLPFKRN